MQMTMSERAGATSDSKSQICRAYPAYSLAVGWAKTPLAQASMKDKDTMIRMVNEEIYRQQHSMRAAQTAAAEEAKQKEKRLNRMLARDLAARKAQAAKRDNIFRRIGHEIVETYSVAFATFVLWGEMLGLWEIEGE